MRKAEIFQGNGIYFFNGNGEINFCLSERLFYKNIKKIPWQGGTIAFFFI